MSESEEDDFSNNSDDGDFSASEDDWVPPKKKGKNSDTTDESSDNSDFETTVKPEPVIGKKRKSVPKVSASGSQQVAKKKPPGQNLREKLYNMYRPPPKTYSSPKQKRDLVKILGDAKFQAKKNLSHIEESKKTDTNSDDSDSSGDDYLVDPNKVDLNASFFDENNTEREKTPPPNFDCNIGMRLSDSENSESDDDADNEDAIKMSKATDNENYNDKKSTSDLLANINKKSAETICYQKLQEFSENLENAKEHLKNFKSTTTLTDNNDSSNTIDVSQLLAMGEKTLSPKKKTPEKSIKKSSQSSSKSKNKRKIIEVENNDSEESDWEEVEDANLNNSIPKDGVQITLNAPSTSNRKKSAKELDLLACIKRQINRKKKENQIYLHKVNVLCWIAYGNSINKIINHPELMAQCIKLIPSKNCYPKDRTDKNYFQQITDWYKTCIALKDKTMYGQLKKLPNLLVSLALQIKTKAAICIRDYVLLFIILLRGMGIQARMVINFVTIPIRPATSELCTINGKEKDDDIKKIMNKLENLEKIKIPQLDGDNEILTDKLKKKTQEYVPSPRKTRSKSRDEEVIKSTISRTRNKEKLPKGSPRVTRSKSRERNEKSNLSKNASTSKERNAKPTKVSSKSSNSEKNKNIKSSPRKTRSQSRDDVKPSSGVTLIKRKSSNKIENNTPVKKPQLSKLIKANVTKTITPTKRLHKSDDDDDDFVVKKMKKVSPIISNGTKKSKQIARVQKIDRRVLSTDDESKSTNNEDDKTNKKSISVDIWIEVYSEVEECWLTIDLIKGKVHKPEELARNASHPLTYVIAWNNDNSIKDVSARYCQQWNTVTRKLRCAKDWLDETFAPYLSKVKTIRDKNEDKELNKIHLDKPLPTVISEFKDHPLYALERHLLKFQAIYPPTAVTLGYIRNEPIYARECVYTLHSREIWVKQARVVKPGEKPYKIVTARPKWDKYSNSVVKNIPLEIFGFWQTKEYEPPTAENGIVPRNAYGNVELFKECMLPKKTVHLQLAGLNRVCKKMRVDCAPAVVGFDFHSGYSHPTFDGFVVCEEHAEKVIEAWIKDQEEQEQREQEKYEKRVYGNWKRLIRGLRIRERLNKKYNFNNEKDINSDYEHREFLRDIDKQLQLVLFNRKLKLENDKADAKAKRKSSTSSKTDSTSFANFAVENLNKKESTLKEKLAKRKAAKSDIIPGKLTPIEDDFIAGEPIAKKETLKQKLAKRKIANSEKLSEKLEATAADIIQEETVAKKETLKEKLAKRRMAQQKVLSEEEEEDAEQPIIQKKETLKEKLAKRKMAQEKVLSEEEEEDAEQPIIEKKETLKEKLAKRKMAQEKVLSEEEEDAEQPIIQKEETLKEKLAKRKMTQQKVLSEEEEDAEQPIIQKEETLREKIAKRRTIQKSPVAEDTLSVEKKVGTRSSARQRNKK